MIVETWRLFSDDERAGFLGIEAVVPLHLWHFRAKGLHPGIPITLILALAFVTAGAHRLRLDPLLLRRLKACSMGSVAASCATRRVNRRPTVRLHIKLRSHQATCIDRLVD